MKICTFFGHHDYSNKIYSDLRSAINTMIDVYAVNTFYVGHQGMFGGNSLKRGQDDMQYIFSYCSMMIWKRGKGILTFCFGKK